MKTIAYHGTDAQFTKFNTDNGVWFISDKTEAEEYGNTIIAAEIILNNPLILSHKINVEKGSSKIIKLAKSKGYDSIMLPIDNNFADEMIYTEAYHNVYIVFSNKQITII